MPRPSSGARTRPGSARRAAAHASGTRAAAARRASWIAATPRPGCTPRSVPAPIRPGTDEAFALITTEVGAAATQAFLDAFAAALPAGVHAALLLDGAGWHTARAIAVPGNVSLVFLPPYSPELNPVERVWLFLRERYLSLRLFAGLDAVVEGCRDAWNRLLDEPGRLASLTDYPYLRKVGIS
jgi:hypothetical protein